MHLLKRRDNNVDRKLLYSVAHPIVRLGFVMFLRYSTGWLAGTIATYCPSRSSELMKKNITHPSTRSDAQRCTCTEHVQEKMKARLRELAPCGQREAGFTQLSLHLFLHVCTLNTHHALLVYLARSLERPSLATSGKCLSKRCAETWSPFSCRAFYRVMHLVANLGWVDLDLGSSHGWWPLL